MRDEPDDPQYSDSVFIARPAGIARFHERFGDGAQAQIEERTQAARTGIPATLAAIKKAAEQ